MGTILVAISLRAIGQFGNGFGSSYSQPGSRGLEAVDAGLIRLSAA
jgi:hypothetical protein